jgi:hypothetical protein
MPAEPEPEQFVKGQYVRNTRLGRQGWVIFIRPESRELEVKLADGSYDVWNPRDVEDVGGD